MICSIRLLFDCSVIFEQSSLKLLLDKFLLLRRKFKNQMQFLCLGTLSAVNSTCGTIVRVKFCILFTETSRFVSSVQST